MLGTRQSLNRPSTVLRMTKRHMPQKSLNVKTLPLPITRIFPVETKHPKSFLQPQFEQHLAGIFWLSVIVDYIAFFFTAPPTCLWGSIEWLVNICFHIFLTLLCLQIAWAYGLI